MAEPVSAARFTAAPPSVASLIAAVAEPATAVLLYLGVLSMAGRTPGTADITLCLVTFLLLFPARNRFGTRALAAAIEIGLTWCAMLAVLWVCGAVTRSHDLFDTLVLTQWAAATPLVLWALAVAGGRLPALARPSGRRRRFAVVGTGTLGVQVAEALGRADARGAFAREFVGYFEDRGGSRVAPQAHGQVAGSLSQLAERVREIGVHEVYLTLPLGLQPRVAAVVEQLRGTTASLFFVPDLRGIEVIQGRLHEVHGVPMVGLYETPFTGVHAAAKRLFDIVFAATALLLLAPLMLVIAAGVKLGSPGPAIFRQRRNGLDGEEIVIYKFRSMRVLEDGNSLRQATRGDARVTRLGAFLRRTSLDELPQFVNVLQGRMSIVGPRPHAVAHNLWYRELVRAYMLRHKVKPGITGWAQVHGCRGETESVEHMRERVAYDLEYLRRWSLMLDVTIIARTLRLVFADPKAY